jgi:alpha-methylacyl-CoA racemase
MLLGMGVLAALHERSRSGLGQVVDAAMVDGTALLTTQLHEIRGLSAWDDERGTNFMDTGSHYYNVYETSDGQFVTVGAMEPPFYRSFMTGLGFTDEDMPPQDDRSQWETLTARVAEIIGTRTRAEWLEVFAGTDACVTPVLTLGEAPTHPHNRARGTFVEVGGIIEPAPAPRFSRTPAPAPSPRPEPGEHRTGDLVRWGFSDAEIADLLEEHVID